MVLYLKHLTIEEIVKYVTANKVDIETLSLLSDVNAHLRECEECKKKIDAYQTLNDQLFDGTLIKKEKIITIESEKHQKTN